MPGVTGRVHSFQSLGTLDGPGVRFVVFTQGCPLRCACCHNPDTWTLSGGSEYAASDVAARAARFRTYFGSLGGVTISGGEPLLQPQFCAEIFRLCHESGINTCLDTSGCVMNDSVLALLSHTDRVLLDVKYTSDEDYRRYVGCGMDAPMSFLRKLDALGVPVTLRQVIIPTLNDTSENVLALLDIARAHRCVDGIELLPFKKICQTKYDMMSIPFPLAHISEPTADTMAALNTLLGEYAK